MLSANIYFNNVKIPEWLLVTDIELPVLPSFDLNNNAIEKKERIIRISFKYKRRGLDDVSKRQELAEWIKGDNFKDSKLILPNMQDYYFLCRANTNIEITGSVYIAQGTIEFICTKKLSMIENKVNKINVEQSASKKIVYFGTVDTYTDLKITVSSECNNIKIKFVNDKYDNYINLEHHFNAGDIIEITAKQTKITVNNILKLPIWTLDSNRHKLTKGYNTYTFEEGNGTLEVFFSNEYD